MSDMRRTTVVSLACLGVIAFGIAGCSDDDGFALDPTNSDTTDQPNTGPSEPSDEPSPPETGAGNPDAEAILGEFLDAINAGDSRAALDIVCSTFLDESTVTEVAESDAKLEPSEIQVTGYAATAEITGTINGEVPNGGVVGASNSRTAGGWCVVTFGVW